MCLMKILVLKLGQCFLAPELTENKGQFFWFSIAVSSIPGFLKEVTVRYQAFHMLRDAIFAWGHFEY